MSQAFALVLAPLLAVAAAAPPVVLSPSECAVFERELSFAHSVETHDAAAFAAHVAAEAAFAAGSPRPQRGREAIVAAWSPIIRGEGLRLEWYPLRTTVVGDIAWSTGPALTERVEAGATVYARSTFQSVWRREADGEWRVVFDGGTPPQPVDAAVAAAFRAARPAACPKA